jgi:His-Xaa-Ser system protein HxsD
MLLRLSKIVKYITNMSEKKIVKIRLSKKLYSINAIFSAAYVFVDRVYVYLDEDGSSIYVYLTAKDDKKDIKELKGEFLNELLNYSLRGRLAKDNKKIRELIIERALYSSVSEEDVWLEE